MLGPPYEGFTAQIDINPNPKRQINLSPPKIVKPLFGLNVFIFIYQEHDGIKAKLKQAIS